MAGTSVELRRMPGFGASAVVEKRFAGGLCRNPALSSPVRTLRRGAPAGELGLGSSGIDNDDDLRAVR